MKNKREVFLVVFSLIIVSYLFFKWREKQSVSSGPGMVGVSVRNETQKTINNLVSEDSAAPTDIPDFKTAENQYLGSLKGNAEEPPKYESPLDAQSDKNIKEFTQIAKLVFSPPAKMRFMKMNLTDDGFEGVYGQSVDAKSGLSVVATERLPSEGEVKKFLSESSDDFPNLRGKEVGWGEQVQKFPAPEGSGLGEAKVWTGKDAAGNGYAAVLILRNDGKGSYFFVYDQKGQGGFDNDGYFDKIFSEVKAVGF